MNPTYRNIGYSPKIWGVSYIHLFTSLFSGVFAMMLFRPIGIIWGFLLALLSTAGIYAYYYWLENADMIELEAKRRTMIGKNLVSYCHSRQSIKIIRG
jgi:hypothetical protein